MNLQQEYDVIIVGGGHAGTEAALASARSGAKTLLLTHNIETLGQMSCNPAIGGIGKGHLVKEIDAMGGVMAQAIDRAGIQFRILNASKGPAVRATRAQADRFLYRQVIRQYLESEPNLTIFQQAVDDLIVEKDQVLGIVTQIGVRFKSRAVVLCAGTFLGGKIHIGGMQHSGGRAGDPPSIALSQRLRELPFNVGRLKTGTPPRVDGKSIDYSALEEQAGDTPIPVFSFWGSAADHPAQVSCHIAYTNSKTHDIIRSGIPQSPMFTGAIEGIGPRYCPSIEDKVTRFADKNRHQVFIEPEGLTVNEVYVNGISTSLPFEYQVEFVRSIAGFENAHITRPGYAIEYDFFDPRDLKRTLETQFIRGLLFAGQINGTTGYEEAAAQGLLAGINAARFAQDKEGWYPRRDEAYIGVLVDDLISLGTQEPYRMFTSRAEYRLSLREDNADERLSPIAHEMGLLPEKKWSNFNKKRDAITLEEQRLRSTWVQPNSAEADALNVFLEKPLSREYHCLDLLKRPNLDYRTLLKEANAYQEIDSAVAEQVEIRAKYSGYIQRQAVDISRVSKHENTQIPEDLDLSMVSGLSNEIVAKLKKHKPQTLGQASRISGVTPAAISLLLIYIKKYSHKTVA